MDYLESRYHYLKERYCYLQSIGDFVDARAVWYAWQEVAYLLEVLKSEGHRIV